MSQSAPITSNASPVTGVVMAAMSKKLISSALLAVVAAVLLFLLMQALIAIGGAGKDDKEGIRIKDVVMPDVEPKLLQIEDNVERPDLQNEPPPDIAPPEVDASAPTLGSLSFQPKVNVDKGAGGLFRDGEYLPIFKVPPQYPRRAQERGIEGYVLLSFTVTATGTVKNPLVIEAVPPRVFDSAAKRAALKFKYKPKVVDGKPVEVEGVMNKITFQLSKDEKRRPR